MKQATTPTIMLRTRRDLSDCTEVRVALTKRGATTPTIIKSLSDETLTVPGAGVMFTLTQAEATALGGVATIDMRAKTSDNTVIGFKQKSLLVNRSFDQVVI